MSLVVELESSLEVNGKTSEVMDLIEAHLILLLFTSLLTTLALLTLRSGVLEGNT